MFVLRTSIDQRCYMFILYCAISAPSNTVLWVVATHSKLTDLSMKNSLCGSQTCPDVTHSSMKRRQGSTLWRKTFNNRQTWKPEKRQSLFWVYLYFKQQKIKKELLHRKEMFVRHVQNWCIAHELWTSNLRLRIRALLVKQYKLVQFVCEAV